MESQKQIHKSNKNWIIKILIAIAFIILIAVSPFIEHYISIKLKGYNCLYKQKGILVDDIKCYYPNGTIEVFK